MGLEEENIGQCINKDAGSYAADRKYVYISNGNKKVTPENLRKEVMLARILGEMSGAERVISSLVANPDWDRDDLEVAIHQFVVDCADNAAKVMGEVNLIGINDVLEAHNYYKNDRGDL